MAVTELEVLTCAQTWLRDGHRVMLATVVDTWGSAPRRAGAQMVVRQDGTFLGSVSGGCIEGAVIQNAMEEPSGGRLLTFGVSTEDAWAVGLSCGGEISVWLEPLTLEVVDVLQSSLQGRRAIGLKLSLQSDVPMRIIEGVNEIMVMPKSIRQADGSAVIFYQPPRRLFIVGAVHIAQALVPMAKQVDYQVVIIDPRSIFLKDERWEDVERISDFPEEYLSNVHLGSRDAVVALSHNPTFDDEALYLALQHNVFYVGALGSRRNHANRCARLQERGLLPEQVARISGPVGLDIRAQTPAEIAVSILAEMIQCQTV